MKLFTLIIASLLTAVVYAQEPPPPSAVPERPVRPRRDGPPMNDEQRVVAEQRADEVWSKLQPREKLQLLKLHRALTEMPPDERKFIHDRVERFLNMSPEDRAKLRENAAKWEQMTPEQRQQAREKFQQHRKEMEEQWRKDHPGEEPPPFMFRHRGPPPGTNAPPVAQEKF